MPDFIPVFVVAVLALLALFVAFGVVYVPEQPVEPVPVISVYEDKVSLGYNFTVADYRSGTVLTSMNGNVTAGIVSKTKKSFSFDAPTLDRISYGRMELYIEDTNLYGPLKIFVNGNTVYNNYSLMGNHEIKFSKNILNASENSLVVRAGGSGWRIWAPTTYIFSLDVFGETAEEAEYETEFNVSYIPSYARLRVYIADREGNGEVTFRINGYKVYKGRSNAFKSFDPDILNEGTNKATVTADYGSKFEIESAYITFE